ncbi:hypothetical protein [Paenibacillus sp. WLX2291]|uniref:hypothetical protein n=1 Tax=Paenibacillus sp. WLX2291 TaxID=3296934 RepID=UPI0039843BD4
MLTFEQKLELLESYPQLQRKNVSLGRVNFHFEESTVDKKIVAFHIHPNGNGFVYAGLLDAYETDDKGFVNIRDYSEEQLRTLLDATIEAMSSQAPAEDTQEQDKSAAPSVAFVPSSSPSAGGNWIDEEGHTLILKYEDDMWCLYAGDNLDMAFESRREADDYLREEGFKPNLKA